MIWLNGTPRESGAIDATSAGNTLGWGVFTTIGIRDSAPTFLRRHFERLKRDARECDLDLAFDFEQISRGMNEILRADAVKNGLARLTLTQRGDGRWNTQNGTDFLITALKTAPPNEELHVQISPYRIEAKRPLAGVKTTSYLPYFWAWREVKNQSFDEAILRDGADFLCEGARSSLFWVKNDALWTPSLETGCLLGIGRDLVLEWAKSSQIPLREGGFEATHIEDAEEAWLVSAASGVRAISSWHNETGDLIRQWNNAHIWRGELLKWWELEIHNEK